MRNLRVIILGLVLAGISVHAGGRIEVEDVLQTEDYSSFYLGIGFSTANFKACDGDCTYEDKTYGGILRAGYDFNEYIGIEARVLRTFLDKGPFGGAPLQHMGIYVKPQYPLGDRFNIYGLLGYGYTENLGNGARLSYFDSDYGFSVGLGMEYDLSDKQGDFLKTVIYNREFDGHADQGRGWSLFLDYQYLLTKSNVPDMFVVSFGLKYDF